MKTGEGMRTVYSFLQMVSCFSQMLSDITYGGHDAVFAGFTGRELWSRCVPPKLIEMDSGDHYIKENSFVLFF